MIDVHCHFDMVKNPIEYILDNERKKIITLGMTNLPSHFQMGMNHVKSYKYIRIALGLHPLMAQEHSNEYSKFLQYINETSYIGEIGLDYSKEGYSTKNIQIKSFDFALESIKNKPKIVSLHSRRAEKEVLEMLIEKNVENGIFHWYSGSLNILKKIIEAGYYLSINSAMIHSENGRKIIAQLPKELVLTETDTPYIENSSIQKTLEYLSSIWKISLVEVESIINHNFEKLLQKIK